MKKSILTVLLGVFISSSLLALDAHISYSTFKGIDQTNFIEVYLEVKGNSIKFEKEGQAYQAKVSVTIYFQQDGKMVNFDKYVLKSPAQLQKIQSGISLVDMRRIALENGDYDLEIVLKDLNDPTNEITFSQQVTMDYDESEVQIADIQLLEGFAAVEQGSSSKYIKHGYFLKPYTYPVFPSFVHGLTFFTEVYNTDVALGEEYLLKYYVCKSGQQNSPIPGMLGFKKHKPSGVNPVIMTMGIDDLPTGNYELIVEVRDQKNELVNSKAILIERSKPVTQLDDYLAADIHESFTQDLDREALERSLNSLVPVMDNNKIPLVIEAVKSEDDNTLRKLLHQYYMLKNELYPEEPYSLYMERVDEADRLFSAMIDEGYETDRGYAYLKYGIPSDVVDVPDETNTYPYQIWVYYETPKGERNVKFVFYNPSLAGGNFVLLHSTARDEISDRQWQRKLYKNIPVQSARDNLEGTQVGRYFGGGRAGDLFNDF